MIPNIIILLCACFAIGGLGVWKVSLRQDRRAANESWRKYLAYLIIVVVMMAVLMLRPQNYYVLSISIALLGGLEIFNGARSNLRRRWPVLLVYALFATVFLSFGYLQSTPADVLLLYTTIVLFDGFSQICGQLIRGPRLARRISPEKRLSGTLGGGVLAVVLIGFFYPYPKWISLILICLFALCGDLLASYIKRRWSIKDYSKLIPGHGGTLDRFDSFMFAAVVVQSISYLLKLYRHGL